MRRPLVVLLSVIPLLALGHVSVTSGNGIANTTQEIVLGVGHGCEGADTSAVHTTIPAGVTSVRAMPSGFGKSTVVSNAAGMATAINWERAASELLPVDTNYYKLTMRVKLPNTPFTVVYFPTVQTCTASDGGVLTTDWTNTTGLPPGPTDPEPAPALAIVPAHKPGWNKFTVPVAVENLSVFFNDAQIVWKGTQAYSPNNTTTELIAGTAGVSGLTALAAGDEVWVKY